MVVATHGGLELISPIRTQARAQRGLTRVELWVDDQLKGTCPGNDSILKTSCDFPVSTQPLPNVVIAKVFDSAGASTSTTKAIPSCPAGQKWCGSCCIPTGYNCSDERDHCVAPAE